MKISLSYVIAKNLNTTSLTEGLTTLEPSFAYHNVTIAVILHRMWCPQLLKEAEIEIFQVHYMGIILESAVAHFFNVRLMGILFRRLLRP